MTVANAELENLKLCECGCNRSPKPDKRFIRGHNTRLTRPPCWRGGKLKHTEGYTMVLKPGHHHADSRGYVFEHRLVYEKHHCCCLLPWVQIHHIDKDRRNNDINNLIPVTIENHRAHHRKDHSNTRCSQCGTNKTRIDRRRGYDKPDWQRSKITGEYLCRTCYVREDSQMRNGV